MSAFQNISFLADGSALSTGWAWQNAKYYNQTNTATGPQRFRLGDASGTTLWAGHDIVIDFTSTPGQYDASDATGSNGASVPTHFYVGSTDPTGALTATSISLVNSTDYLYVNQDANAPNYWLKLDLTGPTGGNTINPQNTGSGLTYPTPRTPKLMSPGYQPPNASTINPNFFSGVGIALGVGWNTYQIYSSATGSSPIGGAGDGGWIFNLIQNDTANEVEVSVEVDASLVPSFSLGQGPGKINPPDGFSIDQPPVTSVQPGDELYLEFDGHHDDVSQSPNMTITTEVIDSVGTTENPSNTVDNTVTAGANGTIVYTSIKCVRNPFGVIKLVIKQPPGTPDTVVAQFRVVNTHRPSHNFW